MGITDDGTSGLFKLEDFKTQLDKKEKKNQNPGQAQNNDSDEMDMDMHYDEFEEDDFIEFEKDFDLFFEEHKPEKP